MIALTAKIAWQPAPRTPCAAAAPPSALPPPPGPQSAAAFLLEWRRDQVLLVTEHPGGYRILGRPYVPRRYHLRDGRTGWTMVHDDPADLAHFDRLFGPNAYWSGSR